MFEIIATALGTVVQPENLLALFSGVMIGATFSAIPGLTSTLALALLLPLTYTMPAGTAFVLMIGMMGGGLYGGMLTAVTLKIPGAPGSVATTFDGHPMFLKGQGGLAIGWATAASIVGGVISAILLMFGATQLARVALSFGPPEMFALTVFGIAAVVSLSNDQVKGSIAAVIGLLLGTVGIDLLGNYRFSFGFREMIGGMPLLPAVVGLFALVKVFQAIANLQPSRPVGEVQSFGDTRMKFPSIIEILSKWRQLLRGSLIGTFIGFLPGAGGNIAAFTAYNVEKRVSKVGDEFGTGTPDGVISAESANNATPGGSLIPTITLGIPGDQFTAVMLGGFIIHGLPVGPLLFRDHSDIIYIIFATTLLMNFLFLPVGYFGSMIVVPLARLRESLLIPIIAAFSMAGLYSIAGTPANISIALVFAVIGLVAARLDFAVAPLILGLILSRLMEDGLSQSLILSGGDWMIFLQRPISVAFLVLAIGFLVVPLIITRPRTSIQPVKE